MNNGMERICVIPQYRGLGGPASFQARLATGLATRGVEVCYDLNDRPYCCILLVGGTRRLLPLWRVHRSGVRVVQRLNGMNWVHRRRRTGWRNFLRAEVNNFLLQAARSRVADRIVYQSHFSQAWWERVYGPVRAVTTVVYNGVDLQAFTPQGPGQPPAGKIRLLCVEGRYGDGYEFQLENAVHLAGRLAERRHPVELMVVGQVPSGLQAEWQAKAQFPVVWGGVLDRARIPETDRSAHLFFSAELNAACPNAVIEALACGLPVIAPATGSLPELVTPQAGRIISYSGNPWRMDPPDIHALADAAAEVLDGLDEFRRGARAQAEGTFGLDHMVERYLEVLLG